MNNWPPSKLGFTALLGFLSGIIISSFWIPFAWLSYFIFLAGAIFIIFSLREKSRALALGLFLILFSFGIFRYAVFDHSLKGPVLNHEKYAGRITEATEKEARQELVVRLSGGEAVLVYANRFPLFQRGDTVEFSGTIRPVIEGDGYQAYLKARGIRGTFSYPRLTRVEPQPFSFLRTLDSIKRKFVDSLKMSLPEPDSSFLSGILIGERSAIPERLREDFVKSGTSHIIALSGFNISIIASAFASVAALFHLSRRVRLAAISISIVLFVVIVGGGASVVRAAVMGVLALLARERGRIYEMTNALLFAAAVMIYLNPMLLRFNLSFQLSFLATLGIILVPPKIEPWLKALPKGIKETVSSTIGAEVFVYPLILWTFGQISLVGIFANLLILSLMPFTMAIGAITAALGFIAPMLGEVFGWFTHLVVLYELGVIRLVASLPGSQLMLPKAASLILAIPAFIFSFGLVRKRFRIGSSYALAFK